MHCTWQSICIQCRLAYNACFEHSLCILNMCMTAVTVHTVPLLPLVLFVRLSPLQLYCRRFHLTENYMHQTLVWVCFPFSPPDSQHYGDVKRRRAPAPSPPEGVQHGELSGLARHPGLLRAIRHLPREPYRNAASLRRSKACGMADRMRDTALGDSQCITTIEDHTRVRLLLYHASCLVTSCS